MAITPKIFAGSFVSITKEQFENSYVSGEFLIAHIQNGSNIGSYGSHNKVRVDSEPSHPGKSRTKDRYLSDGVTIDVTNGGWWELSEEEPRPEMFGAIGDGVANDTSAIQDWLDYGGGKADGNYLIGAITTTRNIKVECGPKAIFTLGFGWSDWTDYAGIFNILHDCEWRGGTIKGSRTNSSVMSGLSTVLGTGIGDVIRNEYKSAFYFYSQSQSIEIKVDNVVCQDNINYGIVIRGTQANDVYGFIDNIIVEDSGSILRARYARGLSIGKVIGRRIDNRPNADNDEWYPANYHAFHLLSCIDCPVEKIEIYNLTGRPGEWFGDGDGLNINCVTLSTNENCPINSLIIENAKPAEGTATDAGSIREATTTLAISDVSNIDCPILLCFASGDFTQAHEAIPVGVVEHGKWVLSNQGGRTNNVTKGIDLHQGQRPSDDSGSGRLIRRGTMSYESLKIYGFNKGIVASAGTLTANQFLCYSCRGDAVEINNQNDEGWLGSIESYPNIYLKNVDIRYNGGEGIAIYNGGTVTIEGGKISDNCQLDNYDDPTTDGGANSYDSPVIYRGGSGVSGPVSRIDVSGVDTTPTLNAGEIIGAVSFIPGTPFAIVGKDDRLVFGVIILDEPKNYKIGQKLVLRNVNSTTDVTVWLREQYNDTFLVEVASTDSAVEWLASGNEVALTGTWDHTEDAITFSGSGGALESDLTGPVVITTPEGLAILQTIINDNNFRISQSNPWIDPYTISNDLSGATINKIITDLNYSNLQTEDISIEHANVAKFRANWINDSIPYENGVPLGPIKQGNWLPAISFDTPGDLAISEINDQSGIWIITGKTIFIEGYFRATLTHTSASGPLLITGLPSEFTWKSDKIGGFNIARMSGITFADDDLAMLETDGTNNLRLRRARGNGVLSNYTPSNVPTETEISIAFSGRVEIN